MHSSPLFPMQISGCGFTPVLYPTKKHYLSSLLAILAPLAEIVAPRGEKLNRPSCLRAVFIWSRQPLRALGSGGMAVPLKRRSPRNLLMQIRIPRLHTGTYYAQVDLCEGLSCFVNQWV